MDGLLIPIAACNLQIRRAYMQRLLALLLNLLLKD